MGQVEEVINGKARYRYLDIARGLGIMLVIISHAHGLSSYLINFYIPIFFLISGFTYQGGRSYAGNMKKKARRLLLPYFCYSFVLLAVYVLIGRSWQETRFSLFGILYSRFCLYDMRTHTDNVFLFTIANGAMWYLTAFFAASLVYHLVIDICLKSKKNLILIFAILIAVTMLLTNLPVLLPWSIDIACVGTAFMIIGTLFGKSGYFEKKPKLSHVLTVFVCYLLLSAINPGINMSVREYGRYGSLSVPLFLMIGVLGTMLCIWVGKLLQNNLLGKALEYIGRRTIILMAFHIFGLEIFEMAARSFIDISAMTGVGEFFYIFVRVTASVTGCLVLGGWIDAMKNWLTKRQRTVGQAGK